MPKSRKPKASGSAEANTYGLPRGDGIRKALRDVFRDQRKQILAVLGVKLKTKDDQIEVPDLPPEWPAFRLGALAMSERMTPMISAYWEESGQRFRARHDLDPDAWEVSDPHLKEMIEKASLAFCEETNATTKHTLDTALKKLREELIAGTVTKGESVEKLTKRVNEIFDSAEKWRARRIAQTEASRAVHAAQEQSAIESEIVAGWELLVSSDACPLCLMVADKAKMVKLGQPFAEIGHNPNYSTIKFAPIHPSCNCTTLEVLLPEYGGPDNPQWAQTLIQPVPGPEYTGEAEKPTKPKPEPEAKPTKPATEPEKPKPVDTRTAPILEAMAAYTLGDEKIAKLLDLEGVRASRESAEAEWRSALDGVKIATGKVKWLKDVGVDGKLLEEAEAQLIEARKTREKAKAKLARMPDVESKLIEVMKPVGEQLKIGSNPSTHSVNPTSIKAAEKFLGEVVARSGNESESLTSSYKTAEMRRAYASGSNIALTSTSTPHTVIHEWGHRIENDVAGVKARANEFLDHRLQGEEGTKLATLFPSHGYRDDEEGRKDKFDKAFGADAAWYVGKRYSDGQSELISMGVEKLYQDPIGFAKKDPEYCKFILGVLDGSLR